MTKLSIIGAGYVGLVTGARLADKGEDVTCVDIDPARVECLNRAQSPIFEEGLDQLLRRNVGSRLKATVELEAAVMDSDLTMIAVDTVFAVKSKMAGIGAGANGQRFRL